MNKLITLTVILVAIVLISILFKFSLIIVLVIILFIIPYFVEDREKFSNIFYNKNHRLYSSDNYYNYPECTIDKSCILEPNNEFNKLFNKTLNDKVCNKEEYNKYLNCNRNIARYNWGNCPIIIPYVPNFDV